MNTKNHNAKLMIAATLIAAFAAGVQAAEAGKVHVNFADLNVNGGKGAKVLYQRIRHAADDVCGVTEPRNFAEFAVTKACKDKAIADAVAQVNVPTLNALYQAKVAMVNAKIALN